MNQRHTHAYDNDDVPTELRSVFTKGVRTEKQSGLLLDVAIEVVPL